NTGNVTLSNVNVTDPLVGLSAITFVGGDTNNDGNLDITEVWSYTATYAVTQDDIDAGQVSNQATATAEDPNGDEVSDLSGTSVENDDPTIVELCQEAQIAIVKTGVFDGGGDCAAVGDMISYTFSVSNQGNVLLSNIALSDPLFESPNPIVPIDYISGDTNNDGILDITEVWIYSAAYTITQEDIDAGEVVNQAFVEATDSDGIPVSDISGTAIDNDIPTIVDLCQEMGIALEKVGVFDDNDGNGSAQIGETITYAFTVYNTGSVTLYNITIQDPLVSVQGGPIASLAPGESDSTTFTAVYVITQADLDAGQVVNQATVKGEDIDGNIIEDLSDDPNNQANIDSNGNGNPDDPTIVILPQVAGALFEIYNGVTPNNDGLNDFFRIDGIENYPNNNVQIFNRWGVLVFERDGYNNAENAFRGVSEGRTTVKKNDELPTGTYFYILRFTGNENPGKSSYSGYLYLNR
ncbi:MAG: T9SS type B sorting domain-containing protein, partial [Flavobacteriia bacterium]|nr:T9SS type B sorting domain-containing protein [Flavobacteriia bacterium]